MAVVEIFQHLDKESRDRIMAEIVVRDPKLAQEIQAKLFTFDDLAKIHVRELQKVLGRIPDTKLALALRGVPEEVKKVIFLNLPTRRTKTLEEEMSQQAPQRAADVEKAQQEILQEFPESTRFPRG